MLSKETKAANKAANKVHTETISNDIDLSLINHVSQAPQGERVKSQLTIIKTDLNKSVEGGVRSVSAYFKEFRSNYKQVENWLLESNRRGRTFDVALIHDILKNGNIKPIFSGDVVVQTLRKETATKNNKEYKEPTQWSANRIFTAFVHAVETTKKPQPKATTTTTNDDDNQTF